MSRIVIATTIAALTALPGTDQKFPSKPISLVIPFSAGGASDLTVRTFIDSARQVLGQPIVVHIRPGGGGAIASEMVGQAEPNGYTLLLGHTNCNSILPAIDGRSRGPNDLVPVCRINTSGGVFVVQPSAPFRTIKQMIAWARANPGQLTVANTGTWSGVDFTWRQMERTFGIKLRIVSYDGGAEALVAVLGGHVQATRLSAAQALPQIRAGRLQAMAYTGARRHPEFPEVPTTAEEGFDKMFTVFIGVMAPKGTPRPIVEKIALAFKKMLESKQAIEGMRRLGEPIEYQGPDEFEAYWRAEYEMYRGLAKTFKR